MFRCNSHTVGFNPLALKLKSFQSTQGLTLSLFSSSLAPLIITIITTTKTSIDTAETDHDPAPVRDREIIRRRSEGLERRVRRRKKPWYRSAERNTE